ncbi:MAG: M23 family metallopeptidase [Armatimonadetes bacterium]|nr:M23 family metallopeptidase [Armatimonadota bacterium]
MMVSLLSKGKRVIPLVCEYESLTVTDIKLPDLLLTNSSEASLTPTGVEILATSKGARVESLYVSKELIRDLIRQVNPQIRKTLEGRIGAKERLASIFGEMSVNAHSLSDSETVGPGQSAIIHLSAALYLHYVGTERIDSLEIKICCEGADERPTASLQIPLSFQGNKIKYSCPLKGNLKISNIAMNYLHHRQSHSQEFGMDILEVRPNGDGRLSTCVKDGSSDLQDYYTYRKPVVAAADGAVVEVADGYPEEETVSPANWSAAVSSEVIGKLAKTIGLRNAGGGNYIVLQHAVDEFSFYAHLSEHSMMVNVGDRVRAGQVIALAGSTGNSSEPHLHFQLMDSKDFLTANGLPVMFQDIPPGEMNQYWKKANSVACSDSLHVFLPSSK